MYNHAKHYLYWPTWLGRTKRISYSLRNPNNETILCYYNDFPRKVYFQLTLSFLDLSYQLHSIILVNSICWPTGSDRFSFLSLMRFFSLGTSTIKMYIVKLNVRSSNDRSVFYSLTIIYRLAINFEKLFMLHRIYLTRMYSWQI